MKDSKYIYKKTEVSELNLLEKYYNYYPVVVVGVFFTVCNLALGEQKGIVYLMAFCSFAAIAGQYYTESWRYYLISSVWLATLLCLNVVVYKAIYPEQVWPSVFGSSLHKGEPNYLTGSVLFLSIVVIGGAVILTAMSFFDRRAAKRGV